MPPAPVAPEQALLPHCWLLGARRLHAHLHVPAAPQADDDVARQGNVQKGRVAEWLAGQDSCVINASGCRKVQYGAVRCSRVQYGAVRCSIVQTMRQAHVSESEPRTCAMCSAFACSLPSSSCGMGGTGASPTACDTSVADRPAAGLGVQLLMCML